MQALNTTRHQQSQVLIPPSAASVADTINSQKDAALQNSQDERKLKKLKKTKVEKRQSGTSGELAKDPIQVTAVTPFTCFKRKPIHPPLSTFKIITPDADIVIHWYHHIAPFTPIFAEGGLTEELNLVITVNTHQKILVTIIGTFKPVKSTTPSKKLSMSSSRQRNLLQTVQSESTPYQDANDFCWRVMRKG